MTPSPSDTTDESLQLRSSAWNRAVYAYGTSRIFERRAQCDRRILNVVTYFGFWPILVTGSLATGPASLSGKVSSLLPVLAIVSLCQLCLSLYVLAVKVDDSFAYASKSMGENSRLATGFKSLAELWPADAEARLQLLNVEDDLRRREDLERGISNKERRFAMREALYHYQRKCVGCNEIPNPEMPKGNCAACGR